ncbi:DUF695 domain-containing protein [Pseudomonas sp. MAP12]|uniref:DUF695 domain-containing protein n=1 Tax=Geopseudomonas aromaticivorans TaxID=2849492 RepID=A0ABS6MV17_9GAMM|nr:DUF695 domain-containing protein [Pseudomonas aromaticivorans]MBV2132661.1 DUF695 domain-containing protein [Pseudomonas aromaticivorans]
MSDHWETFPCQMGNHVAWISYDHGLRTEIESLPFSNCARFAVVLKSPDERGLPSGEEFSHLNAIEDQLTNVLSDQTGIQIGRITTGGKRHFIFFTSWTEADVASLAEQLAEQFDYQILFCCEPDPERAAYWSELFPTEDDWQVIQDIRTEDALRREGEAFATPRPIAHWAHFDNPQDREQFIILVSEHFEICELSESPRGDHLSYTVRLAHTGLPDYGSMNPLTLFLNRSAKECGGDYDGWETQVCRD